MKYKIGKIRVFDSPSTFRIVGISFDWEWYPRNLNIFLYKKQIKIPFVLREGKK